MEAKMTLNLTDRFCNYYQKEVMTKWMLQPESGLFKREIASRVAFLGLGVVGTVTSAVDTAIGVTCGVMRALTAGRFFDCTGIYLPSSNKLIARPFRNLILTINPHANMISPGHPKSILAENEMSKKGLITAVVQYRFENIARAFRDTGNTFLKRHVASRLSYALTLVVSAVTRALDGIIGVIAGFFALLTLGKVERLNDYAYKGLQATGIISDVVLIASKIINPWTGTKAKNEKKRQDEPKLPRKVIFREAVSPIKSPSTSRFGGNMDDIADSQTMMIVRSPVDSEEEVIIPITNEEDLGI
jgi:hypothetical protein